ncbi:RNA polymerase sigma factor [Pseudobacter ginsenosidimutans]|uniref:RNA polymerase sigma-70 factor (ECF subfamily) n=1 Tax=Pseudobacter ginsenosidimutans TaxID=661488 RepID=A0A4Q7MLP4_9BACT|nr:RNA polymerase sigma-70 factor [Pseudobacter ginsenosidimutans]QEC45760.1 RNA polymerase sigma-70 factor [Pseudobacter ginsenosidimutans]RZS69295.1 RNA polymerase sigma-70 factor (ECF subfamily) [Pseudobacter ginsenosidimutans]
MLSNPQYDQAELLLKLSEGDENAFRTLFHAWSPRINAFALKLTGSSVLAEEIVQEAFTKLWQQRAELVRISNFEAWLVTVARNTGSDMLRRMAHERIILHELQSGSSQQSGEENDEEWKQYHAKLYQAVAELPPQQRKVWEMSRFDRKKQQEIAEEMGISIHTVKEYIKKATATLKKNLLKIVFWGIPSFFILIRLL